jgi:tagatose-1,6-bisphosphate aldolase non-catalytic subunit AgaZ/GatZ
MIYIPKQLWVNTQSQSVALPILNETIGEQAKIFNLVIGEFETTSVIQYISEDGKNLHEILDKYHDIIFEMIYQSNGM